ncbi:MAG TPA: ABC transporter substrate-binding protein [Arenicellales bacterium]|nr:ABC transporter substrate-binding protein [Arenicellales bacterium]
MSTKNICSLSVRVPAMRAQLGRTFKLRGSRRAIDAAWKRALIAVVSVLIAGINTAPAETGVTPSTIRVGGVMDLEGRSRGLGQGMRAGILAAVDGVEVNGRTIDYMTLDDSYTPEKTIASTRKLLDEGVFVMLGNVGTPTAKVSLPILAESGVPAVGFFTGAGILRPGVGDIVNFRASYVQETRYVIDAVLDAGATPREVCAYVQNDAYGMAGVEGIKRALAEREGTADIIRRLDEILAMEGGNPARNGLGPVGVYTRNTFEARDGYLSLKNWQDEHGVNCKLVVTVGTYNAIAQFAGYSRYKGEDWLISAVSFTGADNFRDALRELRIEDNVVMTQVVPHLSGSVPIVEEARAALGEELGYVSLEGFIVGKMFLEALRQVEGPLTRQSFLDAILGNRMYLGGVMLDFTTDNQGSDLVVPTILRDGQFANMQDTDWSGLVQ